MCMCVCVCVRVCVRACVRARVCVCVCVCHSLYVCLSLLVQIGVLRRFQHFHSYHDNGPCCIRRDSVQILSAANTDAPCRRHKTRIHHPYYPDTGRTNPLNAERLARKQSVPMLTPLVRRGRGPNPRPPYYALSARPRIRT